MRASTFTLAITLALVSQPALPFDQDEFCDSVTEVAQRMNARRGRWLDRSTRQDGVMVECEAKTLEAKRFVNANPDAPTSDKKAGSTLIFGVFGNIRANS